MDDKNTTKQSLAKPSTVHFLIPIPMLTHSDSYFKTRFLCALRDTVLILTAWPVLVLISYWYWLVGILVGILSTKEFGGNSLRFGGKPFSSQNGGWAPQKGGHDPPFEDKRSSHQKKLYQNVPTKFSSGIGSVNTKKYQPNTDQKYQIGIQL
jgi:hypothetical protein